MVLLGDALPEAVDAEQAFLSSCLIASEAVDCGLDIGLRAADFFRPQHGEVWKAILTLSEKKIPIDFITLLEALDSAGFEDASLFLVDLMKTEEGVLSVSAPHYANLIKDRAIRRHLISSGGAIAALGYDETEDIETLLDRADGVLKRTRDLTPKTGRDPAPANIIKRIEGPYQSGIQTHFPLLNHITGGFQPGIFWVIGGFSSTGKSALAVNMVEDIVRANKSVMIASTEMSQESYMTRALSVTSRVPKRLLRYGGLSFEQEHDYELAKKIWSTAKVRIYDNLYNMTRIRRQAVKIKEQIGLDVLIVDFLQNIHETGDEVKDARIAAIRSQELAKELNCTVIAMSQLSNAQAQAQMDPSARKSGYYAFKGSGAIKDAADIGIMLERDRNNYPNALWCDVVKNREDELGRFALHFELTTGYMRQMSLEEQFAADPNSGRRKPQVKSAEDIADMFEGYNATE
jgi:replicative DNA helicase